MFFSERWLRDLCLTDLPLQRLVELLTFSGTAVDAVKAVGDDHRLELEITSNRTDCYGHRGIARELSVLTGAPLAPPQAPLEGRGPDISARSSVTIEARALCPRYTAQLITDVEVRESPEWLKRRLETIGQSAINAVVDITNYVLWEYSQPLHAFDFDALNGRRLVVREARPGEKFLAINHREYALDAGMLVIADSEHPVCLAGIMGGQHSEITADTTAVLLESAYFEPRQVRRTGRALGLASDSSRRFERGVDPGGVLEASYRAAAMIIEICGGTLAEGVIDVNYQNLAPRVVEYQRALFERVMGYAVADERARALLAGLGLVPKPNGSPWTYLAPSWRADLERPIDLVEEIARLDGFEHAPDDIALPAFVPTRDPRVELERELRQSVIGLGFHECVTDSFTREGFPWSWTPWAVDQAGGSMLGPGGKKSSPPLFSPSSPQPPVSSLSDHHSPLLRLQSPQNLQKPVLRQSLLPSLAEVLASHRAFGLADRRLFEIAAVYFPTASGVREWKALGMATAEDFFGLKGVVERLLERFRLAATGRDFEAEAFAPGAAWCWELGGEILAVLGRASASFLAAWKIEGELTLAELRLPALLEQGRSAPRIRQVERGRQSQTRDFSVEVAEGVRWADVLALIEDEKPAHYHSTALRQVFRGERLSAGRKQFELSVRFEGSGEHFSREAVNIAQDALRTALVERLGGRFQG